MILKKFGIFIIGIVILIFSISGCDNRKDYDIFFEQETIDFGKVNENTVKTLVFRFKNTGKKTLEIEVSHATCGCTTPEDYERMVKPGKWSELPLKFNSAFMVGKIDRSVYLKTNIPDKEIIRLDITGHVFNPVTVNPRNILLGDVTPETTELTGSFSFKSNINLPIIFDQIKTEDNVSYKVEKNQDETEAMLNITVRPPFGYEETNSNFLFVKMGGGYDREYKLSYTYGVESHIQVNPKLIELDLETLMNKSYERRINIKSNIDQAIDILDLRFNGKNVSYSIEPLLKDKFYQIPLIFPKGFTFPEDQKEFTLSFKVKNDPDNRNYNILIKARTSD